MAHWWLSRLKQTESRFVMASIVNKRLVNCYFYLLLKPTNAQLIPQQYIWLLKIIVGVLTIFHAQYT
jgi:hypothetical protein